MEKKKSVGGEGWERVIGEVWRRVAEKSVEKKSGEETGRNPILYSSNGRAKDRGRMM